VGGRLLPGKAVCADSLCSVPLLVYNSCHFHTPSSHLDRCQPATLHLQALLLQSLQSVDKEHTSGAVSQLLLSWLLQLVPGVKVHRGFLNQFASLTTSPENDQSNMTAAVLNLTGGVEPWRVIVTGVRPCS